MALAILAPWPESGADLTAATACLKAELGEDLSDARVQALGSTAAALVQTLRVGCPRSGAI